jgi:endonuclease/exonuclease/phosphatase family metal-dependent hydrolase
MQFEKLFELTDGERNLLVGDFNTDPDRLADGDASAAVLAQRSRGRGFDFLTGNSEPPTYATLFDIDHVLTDFATGSCTAPTITDAIYFDHKPIVCSVTER